MALAEQLMALSPPPSGLIIVDGDPSSGKVHDKLKSVRLAAAVYLVPSNHANLPYQRYLGWRLAKVLNADILLYLDDDLRVDDRAALNLVVGPISRHERHQRHLASMPR